MQKMLAVRKMWPVLAALVILTTACRFETNATFEINDDGSGRFMAELGLDDEMRDLLESFGGGDDLLSGLDIGGGEPVETRIEGDMTFFSSSQSFADTAELKAILENNNDQVTFEELDLEVDERGARFVAKTGPLAAADGIDINSLPIDPTTLTDDVFSANIFVKLPGNLDKHNADEVMSDGRLRWAISFTDPIDIEAESNFGGGGIPWLPIGIATITILGVGGFLVARRSSQDAAAAAVGSMQAPPAPMDFSAPQATVPVTDLTPADGDDGGDT